MTKEVSVDAEDDEIDDVMKTIIWAVLSKGAMTRFAIDTFRMVTDENSVMFSVRTIQKKFVFCSVKRLVEMICTLLTEMFSTKYCEDNEGDEIVPMQLKMEN